MSRSGAVEELKKSDAHPYPHKFNMSISLTNFIEKYDHLKVKATIGRVLVE